MPGSRGLADFGDCLILRGTDPAFEAWFITHLSISPVVVSRITAVFGSLCEPNTLSNRLAPTPQSDSLERGLPANASFLAMNHKHHSGLGQSTCGKGLVLDGRHFSTSGGSGGSESAGLAIEDKPSPTKASHTPSITTMGYPKKPVCAFRNQLSPQSGHG